MTIGIIGCGNMGFAFCQALINKDVVLDENITISDKSPEKLKKLEDYGVKTTQSSEEVLNSDFIILAVKPQAFAELAQEISGKIPGSSTIISIMAGTAIKNISQQLKHNKIVRCMPNTSVLVNEGVIGWFPNENIDEEEKNVIQIMLESTGFAFQVDQESDLDAVTTISGSGPGFFYYLIEQWLEALKDLPFSEELSKEMLIKTLSGSLKLAESSEKSLAELRDNVTSKGGTTAAGLKKLEAAKLDEIFSKMIKAALKRCQEIG